MDRIVTKLRELSTDDNGNLLMATFLATMLATVVASFFLTWAIAGTGQGEWLHRLVASLGATLIYGGTAAVVFYVILPQSRQAFRKIWRRQK